MSQQRHLKPPKPLQADHVTARVIREDIWRPAVQQNNWSVFVVVGREGDGKSLTCASILKAADPSFTVDDAHFDAVPFLKDVADEEQTPGTAIMGDEVGVAFGKRTWHDREQIEANQALQTARNDNRIIGLTLPRLGELDVQLHGRLHFILETVKMKKGDWVEVSPYVVDVSRKGEKKEYEKRPKMYVNGRSRKVERFKIGPPPQEYVNEYEPKKNEWKDEIFDRTKQRYRGEDPDEEDGDGQPEEPQAIADDSLANGEVDKYTNEYQGNRYIDADLLELDYDVGGRRSQKAKKALEREVVL